jgi:GT2 family glycosyltransferase
MMIESGGLRDGASPEGTRGRPARISVVLPVKNSCSTLALQLGALAAQDYDGDVEIVISDNGSTDGTRELVDELNVSRNLSLRWIDSSQRVGECHARNEGIRAAKYEFIACCDADDRVTAGWLSALAEVAAEADVVGGSLETSSLNDAVVSSWRPTPDMSGLVVCGSFLPYAQGCNMAFWKTAWEAIGGYDESFGAGGGDIEFCWRAQTSGFILRYAPSALVAYRFRTGLSDSWNQVARYGRGQATAVARYRHLGASHQSIWVLFAWVLAIVVASPLFPWGWGRKRLGAWVWSAGGLWGCLSGGVSERFLYF